jgi:uncharacterized RDD family membrane protein YckC
LGKRLFAGLADLLPLVALALFSVFLKRRFGVGSRTFSLVLTIGPAVLLLLRDSLRRLSPGKFLMGLRTVDRSTGEPAGVPESVLRNLPLLPLLLAPLFRRYGIPIAGIVLVVHCLLIALSGRGLGDLLAGTTVKRA